VLILCLYIIVWKKQRKTISQSTHIYIVLFVASQPKSSSYSRLCNTSLCCHFHFPSLIGCELSVITLRLCDRGVNCKSLNNCCAQPTLLDNSKYLTVKQVISSSWVNRVSEMSCYVSTCSLTVFMPVFWSARIVKAYLEPSPLSDISNFRLGPVLYWLIILYQLYQSSHWLLHEINHVLLLSLLSLSDLCLVIILVSCWFFPDSIHHSVILSNASNYWANGLGLMLGFVVH